MVSPAGVVLTAFQACFYKENDMGEHSNRGNDSRADAAAILVLILLAVATAVFWVSQQ